MAVLLCLAVVSAGIADSWICPVCGQNDNTENFCTNCGTPRPDWTCPDCGQIGNTGNYCTNCGRKRPDSSGGATPAPEVTLAPVSISLPKSTPTPVPEDIVESGKWSDNLSWTLDRDGTLTIRGKGKMENNRQWNGTDRTNIKTVVIEKGVTIITIDAFKNLKSVKHVVLPDTVRRIDSYAFSETALESITIPVGVTEIGPGAFYGCKNLKTVEILGRIEKLKESVFSHCEKLTQVTIPRSVKDIEKDAFSNSGIETIAIPGCVEYIGENAFQGCKSLREVYLEEGLIEIGSRVFSECSSLTALSVPESVISIGNYAFSGSGLEIVYIPGSIEKVGEHLFLSTPLKEFYFGGSREQWERFGLEIGRYCAKVFDGEVYLPLPTVTPLPPHTDFHAYSN